MSGYAGCCLLAGCMVHARPILHSRRLPRRAFFVPLPSFSCAEVSPERSPIPDEPQTPCRLKKVLPLLQTLASSGERTSPPRQSALGVGRKRRESGSRACLPTRTRYGLPESHPTILDSMLTLTARLASPLLSGEGSQMPRASQQAAQQSRKQPSRPSAGSSSDFTNQQADRHASPDPMVRAPPPSAADRIA